MNQLTFFGHAAFQIELEGLTLQLDPFLDNNPFSPVKASEVKADYILVTHGHSDHTAGNAELRSMFNAKIIAHKLSRINAAVKVDADDVIRIGSIPIKVIHTPGHTPDGICLLVDNQKLLTGDTLFVGECGRTDLPGGDFDVLINSIHTKLFVLDDETMVYPGHGPTTTIGKEKTTNPFCAIK